MPLSDLIDIYASDYTVIDFLKIDVEGSEHDVVVSGDWGRHRPRVLIIEAVDRNGTPNFEKWEELLKENGYVFGLFDGLNRFYCRQEDADELLPLLSAPANIFDNFRFVREAEAAARAAERDARLSELETHLESITIENDASLSELSKLRAVAEESRVKLMQVVEANAELSRREASSRSEAVETNQALAIANERCNELSAAVTGQRGRAEIAELKLKQSEDNRSQLLENLSRLRGNIAEVRQRLAGVRQRLATSESRLASITTEFTLLWRALRDKFVEAGSEGDLILQVSDVPESARKQLLAAPKKKSLWVTMRRSEPLMATRSDLISTSGLFDPGWYLAAYPDVAKGHFDALNHFNDHGSIELRNPGPLFDCKRYLAEHLDVQAAGIEPFMHYLIYGRGEGRKRFSVDGRSENPDPPPTAAAPEAVTAAPQAAMDASHLRELITGFCAHALKRSLQDEEISHWRKTILEQGFTAFVDGVLKSSEAITKKEQKEKARVEALMAQLRRIDDDPSKHTRVDELVQEISGSKVRVQIATEFLERLPFPVAEKLSKSTAIDLVRSDADNIPFSIIFRRSGDDIELSCLHAFYVVLLESRLQASDWLSKPIYRVSSTVEMSEGRKRIIRQLPAGWEVSPIFHLHRVDGFDRASMSPAVVVQQVADEHLGNYDLACWTAAQLMICHYLTRDAAEALLWLDRFDRRQGSTFADRYKAITGAHA
jgi:hypothetical protein